MVDVDVAAAPDDNGNDVESNLDGTRITRRQPRGGGPAKVQLLRATHGLGGRSPPVSHARFHFAENDQPTPPGDEIDLDMARAEIPLDYDESGPLEVSSGDVLPGDPERTARVHPADARREV